MSESKKNKEIGSFIFGALFLLVGFFTINEKPQILAVFLLICGVLIFPLSSNFIQKKLNMSFKPYVKIIIGLIPIIIIIIWGVSSDIQEDSKIDAWIDSTYGEQLQINFKITKDFSQEEFQYFLIEVFDDTDYVFYKKHDYNEFQKLIDKDFTYGDYYELIIPFTDINKSNSRSNEYLLTLVLNDNSIDSGKKYISGLPYYTESDSFNDKKIRLNISKQMEDYISVTLDSIGLMKISGIEYVRVDIIVKNIGDEKISYYSPNPVILGANGEQLDKSYILASKFKDVFNSGDIYSGVIKSGSLFFEIQDSHSLQLKELIIETGLTSYSKESRNIGEGQALFYDKEYVFVYNLSNIIIN